MSLTRGNEPLCYRRLGRAELADVFSVELEPDQVSRFLGPVEAIMSAVERGPSHSLVAISTAQSMLGFYVVHPEPRDGSCWWLGWLALDRRCQGRGYGRLALAHALQRLRHLAGCRRVRLLVAPDNLRARALYDDAGFLEVDRFASTGELVLELRIAAAIDRAGDAFMLQAVAARARRVFRHRRLRQTAGPHAAWVIGVERGPPAGRRVDRLHGRAQAASCRRIASRPRMHRIAGSSRN